ncbi:MAG: ATP-binding cassette domain-containing protein [Candidatus Omnitrophica bacterium]|nr:ATP-binding cassette domain-containing protein [Candidatus Omnitrophota bacterium]
MAILKLIDITKFYEAKRNIFSLKQSLVRAVYKVNLNLKQGTTLGLVGESGCGKSTLAKIILKLINPTSGTVFFEDKNITRLKEKDFRPLRRGIQIVFQDPYSSLSPRLRVKNIISEPLIAFKTPRKEIDNRLKELIYQVGLNEIHLERLPHQLSGGERQRVGIARALATSPKLLVLDEAVSSLDLSTQAQVLNLLKALQKKYKLTYLFIAHNLSVVRYISDEVAVMYHGVIVEQGKSEAVYKKPLHPYTQLLLSSMPSPAKKGTRLSVKDVNGLNMNGIKGCGFYANCSKRTDKCKCEIPRLVEIEKSHWVRCVCIV